MKKITLFAGFFIFFLFSCGDSGPETKITTIAAPEATSHYTVGALQLREDANPAWQYENLRLYPIVIDPAKQTVNGIGIPQLTALAEAMNLPGFRITERKQFGRNEQAWYNALTVQNKTTHTVFLMAGDVVTGGNQDRVIAHDEVVLPGTLKNIEVFCVEHGRSEYYDPNAPVAEKQVAAFRGYFSVASPQVRRAVHSGDQQGVWDAVASVTAANKAESKTQAYAALETAENEKKDQRAAYLRYFDGKFSDLPNTVGMVAVCNGKVVGVDIFGDAGLFQQEYKALLHGYVAEAAAATGSVGEPNVANAFYDVAVLAKEGRKSTAEAGRFEMEGDWVHLYRK